MKKVCYIIAGVNGSGKTTFAKEFLPFEARCINFVNADLIAEGLAPFRPENAAIKAAKIMIQQIDECIRKEESFAFETTLSGRRYIRKIKEMKSKGYDVVIYFLKLASVDLAIERVKMRVLQGGHNVPEKDIKRRFDRSWNNFEHVYKPLVDAWVVFDTSSYPPIIVDKSE
ncbi:MAG: zeta toxin family protein [Deltaproteobacteria bacterium]|nr:zeta toxin family protein [Deltaproteobacteria bacterium]